jgi:phosphohistidine phosphatase SixA
MGIPWRFTGLALALSALVLFAGAASIESALPPEQVLNALRKGGCTVYLRHAQTDRSRDDIAQPDLKDCVTQRLLSKDGEKQADEVGTVIRALRIPVGEVFCSPYCRALETARRAFAGQKVTEVPELSRLARVSREKVPACNAKLRELLSRGPNRGDNTFIVGHSENLAAVGGPDLDEAGWAVFRPSNGIYQLIGRLNPAQWSALARTSRDKR